MFLNEKDAETLLLINKATTWNEFMAAMDGVPLKPETIHDFGDPNKEKD